MTQLQKKLDENCSESLTIRYGWRHFLKASVDTELTSKNSLEYTFEDISDDCLKMNPHKDEIKSLHFRACKFTSSLLAETLVKLISNGLEKLALTDSEITGQHLQYVGENFPEKNKLKDLDLSHIPLDKTGVIAISKIIGKAVMLERLNLHNCQLDEDLLKTMLKESKEQPVQKSVTELNLSSNPAIRGSMEIIAEVADKFGCEEINISGNSLDSSHFTSLASTDTPKKLATVCVCENPIDNWEPLGKLAKKWQVKILNASHCVMHLDDAKAFAKALANYRLKILVLYHPYCSKSLEQKLRDALKDAAVSLVINYTEYAGIEPQSSGCKPSQDTSSLSTESDPCPEKRPRIEYDDESSSVY